MPTKPTTYPRWADGGSGTPTNQIAPLSAQQDSGWTPGKLGAQVLNWLLYNVYTWIVFFDSLTNPNLRLLEFLARNMTPISIGTSGWNEPIESSAGTIVMTGWDGANAQSAKSTDGGATWTGGSTGLSTGLISQFSTVFGASKYLCASNVTGAVYSSTDGLAWSATGATLTATAGNHLAFGASLFVAIDGNGVIKTSPDGVTWTTRTTPGGITSCSQVKWLNGKFVAVCSSKIITSTDGITWTIAGSLPASGTYQAIGYDGSALYVCVGSGGVIASSPDLATWTQRQAAGASTGTLNGVAAGGGGWVTGGSSGFPRTYFSTDGIAWTPASTDGQNDPLGSGMIFTTGKRFLTGGSGQVYRSLSLS